MSDSDEPALDREALKARLDAAGQGHVLRFLDELSPADAEELLRQAAAIDLDRLAAAHALGTAPDSESSTVEPPGEELIRRSDDPSAAAARAEARERGLTLLRDGRVAVVVAAGGQGTRLGTSDPKATFPVGPLTQRSLLAWIAAKVLHWSRRFEHPIPLVLMLSDATAEPTLRHLRERQFFGLDADQVHSVVQGSLAPLDDDGRLLLETKSKIAMSPNGHGGLYAALTGGGLLDQLESDGVTTLSYVQIDNPLIQPIDPVFLGFHAGAGSLISSKSVAKSEPGEKVGVFARVDGRSGIVEYSELTEDQARAVDDDGHLLYGQGSIAAHCIDVTFARTIAERGLPVHHARKRVPYIDGEGSPVAPERPNATKFEMFLFDAVPLAETSLVVETLRVEEFSPIKNATGGDSPETCARDLQTVFRGWYERAGLELPDRDLEIDPEEAPDERAFRERRGLSPEA